MAECTRFACYLQGKGQFLSFPLITLAGLADGINPCAIGMMVMLLGYLVVFNRGNRKKLITIGGIYVLTVFITYLVIGLGFYKFISQINLFAAKDMINRAVGIILIFAGSIQIKDFFWPNSPIHLRIPGMAKERLTGLVEKSSIPATIILGILVTLFETPCSLPLYVGTANILAQSGLPLPIVVGYFLYYNFLFVLPLIIVLGIVLTTYKVIELREWEHKAEKWMKLGIGTLLLIMGTTLLL